MTTTTHQQDVDARVAKRTATIVSAASPATSETIATMHAVASQQSAEAEELLRVQSSRVSRISDLLDTESRLRTELECLRSIEGIAANGAANGAQALDYYVAAFGGSSPHAPNQWRQLTDEMMRAAVVAPQIPNAIKVREDEIASGRREMQQLGKEGSIDLVTLAEALKKERQLHEHVGWMARLK